MGRPITVGLGANRVIFVFPESLTLGTLGLGWGADISISPKAFSRGLSARGVFGTTVAAESAVRSEESDPFETIRSPDVGKAVEEPEVRLCWYRLERPRPMSSDTGLLRLENCK